MDFDVTLRTHKISAFFLCLDKTMSCPLFIYGFTAGSLLPLSIVYLMRPESLTNLWELFSPSLLLTLISSGDVAERFNLTSDLLFDYEEHRNKIYSCISIEVWYRTSSWLIYLSFLLSLILIFVNQRSKRLSLLNSSVDEDHRSIDFVFCYFCIFLFAQSINLFRIFVEYYYLENFCKSTLICSFWYFLSFLVVCLRDRF